MNLNQRLLGGDGSQNWYMLAEDTCCINFLSLAYGLSKKKKVDVTHYIIEA